MKKSVRNCSLLLLALSICSVASVTAQDIRFEYRDAPGAMVIDSHNPSYYKTTERVVVHDQPVLIEGPVQLQSNYDKRLSDMLDQINMANSRGWISPSVARDLLGWQSDLLKEEKIYRGTGGGMIPRDKLDTMEKHLNGLAFIINRRIDEGSRRK